MYEYDIEQKIDHEPKAGNPKTRFYFAYRSQQAEVDLKKEVESDETDAAEQDIAGLFEFFTEKEYATSRRIKGNDADRQKAQYAEYPGKGAGNSGDFFCTLGSVVCRYHGKYHSHDRRQENERYADEAEVIRINSNFCSSAHQQ